MTQTASASVENTGTQPHQVLVFGDLSSSGVEDDLRKLLHIKTNPLLVSFFEQVGFVLRRTIGGLPSEQQDWFPRFTTLIDLVARLGETAATPVLRFFVLSVYEVAQFIVYFGEDARHYPSPASTYTIGPCTGSFAAAAVTSSQTLSELVPVAVEAVLTAFRTALRSWVAGQDVSPPTSSSSTKAWSVTVSAKAKNEAIGDLLAELETSESTRGDSKLYISATTPTQVTTISGPPAPLASFVEKTSERLRSRYMDVQSPFHAAHVFDESDVEHIVSQIREDKVGLRTSKIPLISTATGQVIAGCSFKDLLRVIVRDTLRTPVRWELVASTCRSLLIEGNAQKCAIVPFSSYAAPMLSAALSSDSGIQVTTESTNKPDKTSSGSSGRFEDSKIAIIGYSGRFPDSASNEEFWQLLRAGRDVHREIPPDRFDWKTHYDPTGKAKNTSRIKYGCFIKEPGLFDVRFFNMSPREAENTDPAQRLAITTTYEALEMAGLVRNRTPSTQQDRIGVFFGTTSDDWREVNSGQNVDTYFIPGGNRAFVPGRISYFFRFSGPSLSMDTACSSSFAAIQTACSYLWRGDCDTAVTGGTNILTNPDNFAGLDRGHFLSTTGNCNAFDDGASGYCRADAVATVILKRLEDAQADNDPIFGVIAGTNTNHCGQTDSITRPHEGDQSSVFKRIMRYANVDPLDVSYIEMHGTGTQAGDATEMNSVLSVFGPDRKRTTITPHRKLYLGSAKGNIGHAESASGVSSLIKVLMMMKNSEIPPHAGIKTKINHNYPLDLVERGVHIALETTPWRREDSVHGKRAVFLNNFSAAGGNTAVLLEDAPLSTEIAAPEGDARPLHVVAVTAKTPASLIANLSALSTWLEKKSDISLPALSYTATARRMHHNYRALISGSDIASIISSIKTRVSEGASGLNPIPSAAKLPNVVFAFTGQGSLYTGLGKSLYDTNPSFRASILRFNRLAHGQGFPSFLGLVDGSQPVNNAKDVGAVISQLALTCVQMALFELWRSWGLMPSAVIGHSLGEYAGLYAAGVISTADAIFLVGTRATLLERDCAPGTHAMLALKAPLEVVNGLTQSSASSCELACANQPTGHVISGNVEDISQAEKWVAEKGIEAIRLEIPYAFHSAQVDPILDRFQSSAAKGVVYHAPTIPVLSPFLSRTVAAGENSVLNASYLVQACRGKVDFVGALEAAKKDTLVNDRTIWLELGAHPACGGMVKGTLGPQSTTLASLRKQVDGYKTMTSALEALYLAGFDIDWNEYHRGFPSAHQVMDLPRYSWDLKNYWIQYRNDFCLAKGEGMVPAATVNAGLQAAETVVAPKQYKYLSPSVQKVIEESHGSDVSSLVIESDVFDPKLLPVFQGHVVNGAHLCPSSLYADIAWTMAEYMLQGPGLAVATTGLDITDVKVDASLIAQPTETSHPFRVSAKADWETNVIAMSIYSINSSGKRTTPHATMDIRVTPNHCWSSEWKRSTHLITSRIDSLNRSIDSGNSHKLKRGMVYRLFGALVDYSDGYQGMDHVVLDSERLEAVSTITFKVGGDGFLVNPMWIDSLGGVAGFIMNGNDAFESRKQVFINHGWERFRLAEKLDPTKTYNAYNRMQLVEKTLYAGDTYILHEGRVVGIVEGIKFQGIPRTILDRVLPPRNAATNLPAPTGSAPAAQPKRPAAAKTETRKPRSQTPVPRPDSKRQPSFGLIDRIVAIICQEVGISASDLMPESEFADFGLDSLLSLTILGRIREELQVDLPPSLFVDCSSVSSLKAFVGDQASDSSDEAPSPRRSRSQSSTSSDGTQVTIPTPKEDQDIESSSESASSEGASTTISILRKTLSEETGVSVVDLTPATCLADVGVDSLLALNILAKLDEMFGDALPRSLFAEHETLQDVEKALLTSLGIQQPTAKPPRSNLQPTPASQDTAAIPSSPPHATSVILQRITKAPKTILFLLPDGSGSASSYAALGAAIGHEVTVYGLNCPWLKIAPEMTHLGIDMTALAAKYVAEITRVLQKLSPSKTPIALGGWSAGGILALEAIRQLHAQGRPVAKLVLIDSPNPIGLQNPPERMYDFFDSIGIFGGGRNKMPAWLRAHFAAFINILDAYEPTPLAGAPETLVVYARDGVCKDPDGPKPEMRADDPREMLWLLNNRTDFAADGWRSLLTSARVSVKVVDGVNHFSIVEAGEGMAVLVEALGWFLG
ncbi:polyketide synthase [Podospora appendiculata]|uniref:Polyketide synthase n=1 Tax=Podospora appendiculata TaxID=314037 RepID=A0AAE0WZM7_9PEZI|nr:polyketide synthase [Podospora appendiculata]